VTTQLGIEQDDLVDVRRAPVLRCAAHYCCRVATHELAGPMPCRHVYCPHHAAGLRRVLERVRGREAIVGCHKHGFTGGREVVEALDLVPIDRTAP
jgi:hypothetical protein